ncbi:hypothetical protein JW887_05200 [Candidatus Dojkabacteria bacterium]|nr:hypothetical protein [Candidatus Dojkabacteria bacterium]
MAKLKSAKVNQVDLSKNSDIEQDKSLKNKKQSWVMLVLAVITALIATFPTIMAILAFLETRQEIVSIDIDQENPLQNVPNQTYVKFESQFDPMSIQFKVDGSYVAGYYLTLSDVEDVIIYCPSYADVCKNYVASYIEGPYSDYNLNNYEKFTQKREYSGKVYDGSDFWKDYGTGDSDWLVEDYAEEQGFDKNNVKVVVFGEYPTSSSVWIEVFGGAFCAGIFWILSASCVVTWIITVVAKKKLKNS